MIDLTGKVALVTGSSRGIGRACAIRLAEAGADVIVNYVSSRSAANEVADNMIGCGFDRWACAHDVSLARQSTASILRRMLSNAVSSGSCDYAVLMKCPERSNGPVGISWCASTNRCS